MRKLVALAAALAFVPALAMADLRMESAFKKVAIVIDPNITLSALGQVNETANFQTGDIEVPVQFSISANTQYVELQAQATDLFKASDPASPNKVTKAGPVIVEILPDGAGVTGSPAPGFSSGLAFDGAAPVPTLIEGKTWPLFTTVRSRFQSGNAGTFTHDMKLYFHWNNNNGQLARGDYGGYVKLIGFTVTGI